MTQHRSIASVWLPRFGMDLWRRTAARERDLPSDDDLVALKVEGAHGAVIHALSTGAEAAGIRIGQRIVDARAAYPPLHVEDADLRFEEDALRRLTGWSRRWCPWTATDGADGLVLDLTGAEHLQGGAERTLLDIEERLGLLGLSTRTAVAPTRGAAWALARFGPARAVVGTEDLEAALAPLPVRALRIGADQAKFLERVGLKTIGALSEVDRVALARRFPPRRGLTDPVLQLDRATGRMPEPVVPDADVPRFLARARLVEPVMDVAPLLQGLAVDLCRALDREGVGARLLRLTIYRIDGERREARVSTAAATRDAGHVARLLAGHLDNMDPGFGFDLAVLEAVRAERMDARQTDLTGRADPEGNLSALVDRLTARFGPRAVTWTDWRESHLPERCERPVPAIDAPPVETAFVSSPARSERPLRLFPHPEEVRVIHAMPDGPPRRFAWRGVSMDVARREGPERIAPEWWRDRPGTRLRDYWKVEVADGRRFWIYREGTHDDGRGDWPAWYLHGLFA
ncbi:protein ImuB [Hasllibacter halocynthiae]|uniref:Protein ImuB n=1 Tax=Hasllibacter halocynthiae TaxID=595589 RepID=A0A2T0X6S7_9RHOB|nr:DNA polymerase Y family protein [Hasllibacter halocynthiae]PRY94636.1 protein ImuB [Hasllibacter halocynthiae]